MSRKEMVHLQVVGIVSASSDVAWIGFSDVSEAIQFKKKMDLKDDWRIRDRRTSAERSEASRAGTDLSEAMLIIGSMISDHISSHVSPVYGQESLPSQVRREALMFASSMLREAAILCEKDFGKWRPMRGKLHHLGMDLSHAWLEDEPGNILDVLPWNQSVMPLSWHSAQSASARGYQGVSVLGDGHGTGVCNILRGIIPHPAATWTSDEFRRRNDLLATHIHAFLSGSRLPLKAG